MDKSYIDMSKIEPYGRQAFAVIPTYDDGSPDDEEVAFHGGKLPPDMTDLFKGDAVELAQKMNTFHCDDTGDPDRYAVIAYRRGIHLGPDDVYPDRESADRAWDRYAEAHADMSGDVRLSESETGALDWSRPADALCPRCCGTRVVWAEHAEGWQHGGYVPCPRCLGCGRWYVPLQSTSAERRQVSFLLYLALYSIIQTQARHDAAVASIARIEVGASGWPRAIPYATIQRRGKVLSFNRFSKASYDRLLSWCETYLVEQWADADFDFIAHVYEQRHTPNCQHHNPMIVCAQCRGHGCEWCKHTGLVCPDCGAAADRCPRCGGPIKPGAAKQLDYCYSCGLRDREHFRATGIHPRNVQ